jgi:peptidoglycan/xylan/chitin deacetylase (PgdA/CDA1 family)
MPDSRPPAPRRHGELRLEPASGAGRRVRAPRRGSGARARGLGVLRRTAGAAARLAAASGILDLLERAGGDDPNLLRVLTYHRIAEPGDPSLYPGVWSATPRAFEGQLRELSARFRVISLPQALAALRGQAPLPPRALLVTFDDAYRDFAELAWPVLRSLGLPAVLFVPTAFPDRPERAFWWDRLHRAFASARREAPLASTAGPLVLRTPAERQRSFRRVRDLVKALPHRAAMELVEEVCGALEESPAQGLVLGWGALRALAREGVAVCAHTRSHPLLDRIDAAEVRAEVAGSLADLCRELGDAPPVLAYPDGRYGEAALRAAREAGIEVAFTTRRGVNDLRRADPLRLRRVPVTPRTSDSLLRAQLSRVAALAGPPRPAGAARRVWT